jgi:phosphatidylserine decarboxylase
VIWFFRDPPRRVPGDPGLVVAPADGRVVDVEPLESDPFVAAPAVRIGIFLSVFNVHINRAPAAARVAEVVYRPGKFLNALRPASARENEQLELRLEETAPPFRRFVVRQIAGTLARRIVCWVRPGESLERGVRYGMIKLGSRTDLILPRHEGLEVLVRPGQAVRAGRSIVARYTTEATCEKN